VPTLEKADLKEWC